MGLWNRLSDDPRSDCLNAVQKREGIYRWLRNKEAKFVAIKRNGAPLSFESCWNDYTQPRKYPKSLRKKLKEHYRKMHGQLSLFPDNKKLPMLLSYPDLELEVGQRKESNGQGKNQASDDKTLSISQNNSDQKEEKDITQVPVRKLFEFESAFRCRIVSSLPIPIPQDFPPNLRLLVKEKKDSDSNPESKVGEEKTTNSWNLYSVDVDAKGNKITARLSMEKFPGLKDALDMLGDKIPEQLTKQERKSLERILVPTHRLSVVGEAGMGKSTLSQYVLYHWAKDEKENDDEEKSSGEEKPLFSDQFDWVFRIPLRNLNAHRYPNNKTYHIIDVVLKECFESDIVSQEVVPDWAKALFEKELNSDRVLWILEGRDELELPSDNQHLHEIWESLLRKPYTLITSRPTHVEKDAELCFKIKEFTRTEIKKYIQYFFKSYPSPSGISAEDFFESLDKNGHLIEIAQTPLHLQLMCRMWSGQQVQRKMDDMSLTEFYLESTEWLFQWFLQERRRLKVPRNESTRILVETQQERAILEKLAFRITQHSGVTATFTQLVTATQEVAHHQRLPITTESDLGRLWKRVVDTGILRSSADNATAEYSFAHPTFQEFLTACYLVSGLSRRTTSHHYREIAQFIRENKYNRRFLPIFRFTAGLLSSSQNSSSLEALESFWNMLVSDPYDLVGCYHITLLISCLNEARCDKRIPDIEKLLEQLKTYFSPDLSPMQQLSKSMESEEYTQQFLLFLHGRYFNKPKYFTRNEDTFKSSGRWNRVKRMLEELGLDRFEITQMYIMIKYLVSSNGDEKNITESDLIQQATMKLFEPDSDTPFSQWPLHQLDMDRERAAGLFIKLTPLLNNKEQYLERALEFLINLLEENLKVVDILIKLISIKSDYSCRVKDALLKILRSKEDNEATMTDEKSESNEDSSNSLQTPNFPLPPLKGGVPSVRRTVGNKSKLYAAQVLLETDCLATEEIPLAVNALVSILKAEPSSKEMKKRAVIELGMAKTDLLKHTEAMTVLLPMILDRDLEVQREVINVLTKLEPRLGECPKAIEAFTEKLLADDPHELGRVNAIRKLLELSPRLKDNLHVRGVLVTTMERGDKWAKVWAANAFIELVLEGEEHIPLLIKTLKEALEREMQESHFPRTGAVQIISIIGKLGSKLNKYPELVETLSNILKNKDNEDYIKVKVVEILITLDDKYTQESVEIAKRFLEEVGRHPVSVIIDAARILMKWRGCMPDHKNLIARALTQLLEGERFYFMLNSLLPVAEALFEFDMWKKKHAFIALRNFIRLLNDKVDTNYQDRNRAYRLLNNILNKLIKEDLESANSFISQLIEPEGVENKVDIIQEFADLNPEMMKGNLRAIAVLTAALESFTKPGNEKSHFVGRIVQIASLLRKISPFPMQKNHVFLIVQALMPPMKQYHFFGNDEMQILEVFKSLAEELSKNFEAIQYLINMPRNQCTLFIKILKVIKINSLMACYFSDGNPRWMAGIVQCAFVQEVSLTLEGRSGSMQFVIQGGEKQTLFRVDVPSDKEHLVDPLLEAFSQKVKSYRWAPFDPESVRRSAEEMKEEVPDVHHVRISSPASVILKADFSDKTVDFIERISFSEKFNTSFQRTLEKEIVENAHARKIIEAEVMNVKFKDGKSTELRAEFELAPQEAVHSSQTSRKRKRDTANPQEEEKANEEALSAAAKKQGLAKKELEKYQRSKVFLSAYIRAMAEHSLPLTQTALSIFARGKRADLCIWRQEKENVGRLACVACYKHGELIPVSTKNLEEHMTRKTYHFLEKGASHYTYLIKVSETYSQDKLKSLFGLGMENSDAKDCSKNSSTTSSNQKTGRANYQANDKQPGPQPTRGDGNCAFHAIFGEWNGRQYEAKEAEDLRLAFYGYLKCFESPANMPEKIRQRVHSVLRYFFDGSMARYGFQPSSYVQGLIDSVRSADSENETRRVRLKEMFLETIIRHLQQYDAPGQRCLSEILHSLLNARPDSPRYPQQQQLRKALNLSDTDIIDYRTIEELIVQQEAMLRRFLGDNANSTAIKDTFLENLTAYCTPLYDVERQLREQVQEFERLRTANDSAVTNVLNSPEFYKDYLDYITKQGSHYYLWADDLYLLSQLSGKPIHVWARDVNAQNEAERDPFIPDQSNFPLPIAWTMQFAHLFNNKKEVHVYHTGINHYEHYVPSVVQQQQEDIKRENNVMEKGLNNKLKDESNFVRTRLFKEDDRWAQEITSCLQETKLETGTAKDKGDCFFDSVAQALESHGKSIPGNQHQPAHKRLRMLCRDYMKEHGVSWVKDAMDKDTNTGGQNYTTCLMQLEYTVEEIEQKKSEDILYKNWLATWGRPSIEGRMLCEKIPGIKLHTVDIPDLRDKEIAEAYQHKITPTHYLIDSSGQKSIDASDVSYEIGEVIHLVCYRRHYVPLLPPAPNDNLMDTQVDRTKDKAQEDLHLTDKESPSDLVHDSNKLKDKLNSEEESTSRNKGKKRKLSDSKKNNQGVSETNNTGSSLRAPASVSSTSAFFLPSTLPSREDSTSHSKDKKRKRSDSKEDDQGVSETNDSDDLNIRTTQKNSESLSPK